MFDVDDFLNRAKVAAGVTSDYALCVKVLGFPRQSTITNWRSGRSVPDERSILKLCELTGDDPVDVAVRLQSMRAANDDAAGLWRRVAERLKGPLAVALLAIALPFALYAPDADAATVCIMSNALGFLAASMLARAAWRFWRLTCTHTPAISDRSARSAAGQPISNGL